MKKFSCYCTTMRRVTGYIVKCYNTHLAPYNITVGQYSLMKNLSRLGETTSSQLSDAVELERTSVIRNLKPLINRGYIQSQKTPSSREKLLSLTEEGHALLEASYEAWNHAQQEIEAAVGAEELHDIMDKLTKIG